MLVVNYEGKRKNVKITSPNMIIQEIVNEAALSFAVDSNLCSLKYKRQTIQNSQTFRFSSIPSNANVDLVGGKSVVKNYDSQLTLYNVLEQLVQDGELQINLANCNVEIIYLRNSYIGESLKTNTLNSLGLAGASGRLNIKYDENCVVDKNICDLKSTNENENEMIIETEQQIQLDSNVSNELKEMEVEVEVNQEEFEKDYNDIKQSKTSLTSTPASLTIEQKEEQRAFEREQRENIIISKTKVNQNPSQVLKELLNDNFDKDSIGALTTIAKYMNNVISQPEEPKFRRINLSNKVFLEKVQPVRHARLYLHSLGFLPFSSDNQVIELAQDRVLNLAPHRAEVNAALIGLGVDESSRPALVQVPRQTVQSTQAFDPYKANVFRNAPQPARGPSVTEVRLANLERRREELEGKPEDVKRETRLLLPQSDGCLQPISQFYNPDKSIKEDGNNDDNVDVDKQLVSQALLRSMRQTNSASEAPLQTEAVRMVKKLETERVYSKVCIRIRLPDRSCLQAFFHPRHTMKEVYFWVDSCLSFPGHIDCDENENQGNEVILKRGENKQWDFELFQSPPRKVFNPNIPTTLSDLMLSPAAMINFSWIQNTYTDCREYVKNNLVVEAEKCFENSVSSFPSGHSLANSSLTSTSANSNSLISDSTSSQSQTTKTTQKTSFPSWLKIGKK